MRSPRLKAPRGISLLEVTVVVAVMGIVATLSYSSLREMRPRLELSGGTSHLVASISESQSRANSTQGDVLLVFVVSGPGKLANGGYFIYNDPDQDLDFSTYTIPDTGLVTVAEATDRLGDSLWFANPPYKGRLSVGTVGTYQLKPPFSSAAASSCSFCSVRDGKTFGAVAFRAGGDVQFLNASGVAQSSVVGVLSLSNSERSTSVGISALTGLTRVTKP